MSDFAAEIAAAYAVDGAALDLGRGVHDGELVPEAKIRVPLSMLNRHGLIAGATGTGKSKTLQLMAEQLSSAGVSVFVADVKGDLSGLAHAAEPGGAGEKRMAELGEPFEPTGFPVEFLSIGGIGPGTPVRSTVSDFGPELLAKVLEANQTQEDSLGLVFHYADEKGLPLVDLSDLRALLQWLTSDEGKEDLEGIGGLAKSTVGVLLRALHGQAEEFFGEPAFEIEDLIRTDEQGRGVISCLELPAVQDRPRLWSTVMMWLVAELFETLPEAGDLPQPKLVFFLDEAHLLFADASDSFVESVAQTVRLIRSKGVGVFFVTQQPTDIPDEVLAQLGGRVQHALRAFTPRDAKALKATVSTYPKSDYYDMEELLTSLGIGEAAVTFLSEKGTPLPVVQTRMVAPASRMAPADSVDVDTPLKPKYAEAIDRESAREMLTARMERLEAAEAAEERAEAEAKAQAKAEKARRKAEPRREAEPDTPMEQIGDFLGSRKGKSIQRKVARGIFGMLRKRL